ncbi:hypothetical protein [Chryseobacterium sp.]|uniref:hypothetical protein n=1 Tax=Chryseobacterium sp. TaxID=1871047 RepID=UPI0028A0C887|nr:hypothetical protein [Chryseobacterium sp.]
MPIEWLEENYTDHKLRFEAPDYLILYDDYSLEQNIFGAPLGIYQKLLEWHFNVFNLPQSEYIKKATLTTNK